MATRKDWFSIDLIRHEEKTGDGSYLATSDGTWSSGAYAIFNATGQLTPSSGGGGGGGGVIGLPRDVIMSYVGTPADGALIFLSAVTRTTNWPANLSTSQGWVGTNPSVTYVITIKRNGSSIATASISTAGVFTFATTGGTAVTLNTGDQLTAYAPTPSIATSIKDIAMTIAGTI